MKTKVSKLNICMVAMLLLLIFVCVFNFFGKTNSWLVSSDGISMSVQVANIDIEVKQGDRLIENEGYIYIGTQSVNADEKYEFDDITVHNNELTSGYYLRCQVFAKIGDKLYNINNCIENDLYKSADGWMYYTVDKLTSEAKQLEAKDAQDLTKGVVAIIKSFTIPDLLEDDQDDSKDVYFSAIQGKVFTLHLFIEGSSAKYVIE